MCLYNLYITPKDPCIILIHNLIYTKRLPALAICDEDALPCHQRVLCKVFVGIREGDGKENRNYVLDVLEFQGV